MYKTYVQYEVTKWWTSDEKYEPAFLEHAIWGVGYTYALLCTTSYEGMYSLNSASICANYVSEYKECF